MSFFDLYKTEDKRDQACAELSVAELQKLWPGTAHYAAQRPQRYSLALQPGDLMQVTRVEEVHFKTKMHAQDRFGQEHRLAYVTGGHGWLINKHVRAQLSQGVIFSRLLAEPNHVIVTGDEPLKMYLLVTRGDHALALHRRALGKHGCAVRPQNPDAIQNLFEQFLKDAARDHENSAALLSALYEYLMQRLCVELPPNKQEHSRAHKTFLQCRSYITQHVQSIANVSEVAQHCHIDASYLSRLFRRFEQCTAQQFLLRSKMSHACDLLTNSDMSVQQIASTLNFGDQFTFSRAFKRLLGCAPSHYRDDL